MTRDQIVGFWGKESLRRWPEGSVAHLTIPDSSRRFLIDVGLPVQQDWTLRFESQAIGTGDVATQRHYFCIGFDDVVPICLDQRHAGRVVALEAVVGGSERFMNSTVEKLGSFLVLYGKYRRLAPSMQEEDARRLIRQTENEMRQLDPRAFDDPNYYWPVIIEQMAQGLL